MDPKLLRIVYIFEFVLALIAVFTLWSQVGGQTHLDLMAWYLKLGFGVALAYATVRVTAAAFEGERAWNGRVLRWLVILTLVAAAAGIVTYYYHVYEPTDEEQDEPTQTSIRPAAWGRPLGLCGSPWTRLPIATQTIRQREEPARGPAADEGVRPLRQAANCEAGGTRASRADQGVRPTGNSWRSAKSLMDSSTKELRL